MAVSNHKMGAPAAVKWQRERERTERREKRKRQSEEDKEAGSRFNNLFFFLPTKNLLVIIKQNELSH